MSRPRKSFHVVSLGCPKNAVDAEVLAGILVREGYRPARRPERADIVIVNTCAFILPAKEESIDAVLAAADLKARGRVRRLVVTGCLPQRYGKTLHREIPEIDLCLGIDDIPKIASHLADLERPECPPPRYPAGPPRFLMNADAPRRRETPAYSAFLKIADGCSNRCSYCVIPSIRGRARSRLPGDILAEAETLAARGAKELILIAQDTTAYGQDLKGRPRLGELLDGLCSIGGLQWIRLLYAYPHRIDRRLLSVMAANPKICRYLDIPIQHIDDGILRAMRRRGGSRAIRRAIHMAREAMPDIALRTSLIVGFPGETKAAFGGLSDFVREARFDHLGVFAYSSEEGTAAAELPSRIGRKEAERRRETILEEQAAISLAINRTLVGSTQEVLVEGRSDDPEYCYRGRLKRQAPEVDGLTYIRGRSLKPGDIVTARIVSAAEYDLFARTPAL
ncbi:MAG: Ribosomal protein S12 methylthiotransferase RimO [Syntrophaceae bacterium PtaU1.Bin231]|nr:MAG: Ribosomal protein S12 methylthiotransferase RimO [Syntrophaceae bacterium PtaU1.Bin231]